MLPSKILSGGRISTEWIRRLLEQRTYAPVIAADRGLEACEALKLPVDYLLGDFDSVSQEVYQAHRARILAGEEHTVLTVYPSEKDATDTELAIRLALQLAPASITIVGATGTRLDHCFANLSLLMLPLEAGVPACILDEYNRVRLIRGTVRLQRRELYGPYISLIPFDNEVKGVTLSGFHYPLQDAVLPVGSSLGISNQPEAEQAEITLGSGRAWLIESRDEPWPDCGTDRK